MLTFAVFDENGPARDWPVRQAYLLGQDDVPAQGEVRFEGGLICCERRSADSTALSILFLVDSTAVPGILPSGDAARLQVIEEGMTRPNHVMLQTCLLPDREEPYLLSLELARHRIMLFLNKLEEWALFDTPADSPAMVLFETARRAFTDAVVVHADFSNGRVGASLFSPDADKLARRALALAVAASEALALEQARVQHAKRVSGELTSAADAMRLPSSALTVHELIEHRNTLIGTVGVILPPPTHFGCTIDPEHFGPELQKRAAECCDFINLPMRWLDMEPTEGRYQFAKTDRWIEWAVRSARVPIVGGPIIDFSPRCVPEWLYIWEHDYETLRELVYEHVRQIVTRYRRTVSAWTVVSGLHVNTSFTFSFEQVMDLTRMCVLLVRKLQPSAKIQVELDQPWGEHHGANPRSIPPVVYAEMVSQAGIDTDRFGVRVEMGQGTPGRAARDLMAFSAMLDRFAALERPIAISAMSAPAGRAADHAEGTKPGGTPERTPGFWRKPWDEQGQRDWLVSFLGVAASKPYVQSVCWNALLDDRVTGACTGLIAGDGRVRPAYAAFVQARTQLKGSEWPPRVE